MTHRAPFGALFFARAFKHSKKPQTDRKACPGPFTKMLLVSVNCRIEMAGFGPADFAELFTSSHSLFFYISKLFF